MRNIALIFLSLWGWKRITAALGAGLIAALSVEPINLFPALAIAFPIIIWLMDAARSQTENARKAIPSAFLIGTAFGYGYHFVGLFWIHNALLVEPEIFAHFIPAAILLIPLGLGILWGGATAAAMLFWHPGISRILTLSIACATIEWIRAEWFFTGFPWNNLGYALTPIEGLAQMTALIGVYGLVAPTIIIASLPVLIGDEDDKRGHNAIFCALTAAIVITAWAGGTWRLNTEPETRYSDIRLRIIQPNIEQKDKWNPRHQQKIIQTMINLSTRITENAPEALNNTDILIWPESAIPTIIEIEDDFNTNNAAGDNIQNAGLYIPNAILPVNTLPAHTTLITGMLFARKQKLYNSALFINHDNKIIAHYDKFHLVPFGEYIPFANVLKKIGLRTLIPFESNGLAAGKTNKTLHINAIPPLSPLICYEAIFSGQVTEKNTRPKWLVNLSNDAWFGNSWGLHQHLQQSRIRAIEEGLPLIRATNTGISAIIDAYGRITASLKPNQRGIIDHKLPMPTKKTIYAQFGKIPLAISLITLALTACIIRIGK